MNKKERELFEFRTAQLNRILKEIFSVQISEQISVSEERDGIVLRGVMTVCVNKKDAHVTLFGKKSTHEFLLPQCTFDINIVANDSTGTRFIPLISVRYDNLNECVID